MKRNSWLWRLISVVIVAATIICISGFAYAVSQVVSPKVNKEAAPTVSKEKDTFHDKSKIQIVALGDSLTMGVGDETGQGYVERVRGKVEKALDKPTFVVNNFAISGFRTYDILKNWKQKKDMNDSLAGADIILLTAGGNDLFESGQGVLSNSEEGLNPDAAAKRMPKALGNLQTILAQIEKINKTARIFYVGLYNPFSDIDKDHQGGVLIQQWNMEAFKLASQYPNMTVVPTYDLFELNLNKYIYTDHFHPNKDGYERIANRIVDILQ